MKTILTLATVLVATASAHADPLLEVEAGGTAGTDRAMTHQAVYVGAEVTLTKLIRVHGEVDDGQANSPMSIGADHYLAMRGGLDARTCWTPKVCAIAGVDGAMVTEAYVIGHQNDDIFGGWNETQERGGFAVMPRAALDIGDGHWRFRPGVEATLSVTADNGNAGNSDLIGVAGTVAAAYKW